METLSLTQQYLLCILSKKGKIGTIEVEKTASLVAAGILELLMDEAAALDGKKLVVRGELPADKDFLRPVYSYIERKQPVKFETVLENFSITFTDKNINELIDCVGRSLVDAGCATQEKGGLLGGKTVFIPDERALDRIIQAIRAELLEEGELSEEVIALTALLNKSGEIAKYFSAYEKKTLKRRLKEIKENPQNKLIERVMNYIDSVFVMFIVAAT